MVRFKRLVETNRITNWVRPKQIGYKVVHKSQKHIEFITVDAGTTLVELMQQLSEQNSKANRTLTYKIRESKAFWELTYNGHTCKGYTNRAQGTFNG